jgi:SAM-dependent methyltransferase
MAPRTNIWADRAFLRQVQYRTDENLAARQSIYAYQEPKIDLPAVVLDIALHAGGAPSGGVIADIGCGNGAYLAELARRAVAGRVIGMDLSPGMLAAASARGTGTAALVNADATALPLRAASVDLALAMHMLYHVPDPPDAVRELRRVTRPGGTVIVGLNGTDHQEALRAALTAAGVSKPGERLRLDEGETLVRGVFTSVTRHDFTAPLFPPPAAVAAYVHSLSEVQRLSDPAPLVGRVLSALFPNGQDCLPITSHSGILICA